MIPGVPREEAGTLPRASVVAVTIAAMNIARLPLIFRPPLKFLLAPPLRVGIFSTDVFITRLRTITDGTF